MGGDPQPGIAHIVEGTHRPDPDAIVFDRAACHQGCIACGRQTTSPTSLCAGGRHRCGVKPVTCESPALGARRLTRTTRADRAGSRHHHSAGRVPLGRRSTGCICALFWHCRGGEDRFVRSKIAAIEGIADKGAGVLQRWTRVKKGLALIAMLLNARQTLDALLECRTPSLFDKLIYLHVRHHQQPMIAHLVEQVKTAGAPNVTTDWMSKVCHDHVN